MIALLALVLMASSCRAQAPQELFSADMLARLRAARPGAAIAATRGEPLMLLTGEGGWQEGYVSLGRLYAYCRRAKPGNCERAKADFVRKVSKPPPAITPASLRLVLRERRYWDYFRTRPESRDGAMPVAERLGADLYVFLASDSPDAIAMVDEKALAALKLSRAEAWALALRQTQATLPALPTAAQLAESVVVYEGQRYLASLMLDREGWARLAAEAGPDLFVTAVSDEYVLVARRADGAGMDLFKQSVAEDCARQERCLSPNVYRFRSGGWAIAR
jgi:hypothetical protein